MNMLPFIELPWLLALVIVLPVVFALLLRRAQKSREQRLKRFGALEVVRRLIPASALSGSGWRAVRLGGAAALAGLAIAGPRWGQENTIVRTSGVDLVLAVDASLSMLAQDEKPSRLERVKQEIRRLRALSPGDRVGLLAFAGRSYVLTPITVDGGALDLFLDNLDPSVVGQAGSSLASTITQGVSLLTLTKGSADRALVVFSDGEGFEPKDELTAAASKAAQANISLVTVGFGTTAGAQIPMKDANGGATVKHDENGDVVVTRYHPELLQLAANAAHGTFVPAEATDKAARIKSALSRLRTGARTTQAGESMTPRFQWFLLPALLLLWFDTVMAGRRGRHRKRAAAETAVAAALLLAVSYGCAPNREAVDGVAAYQAKDYKQAAMLLGQVVKRGDQTPRALYNYGTALIAADSTASAAEILDRLADKADTETQYRSRFNGGLAHLIRGRTLQGDSASTEMKAALAAYKRVLLQRPNDLDAKWNYELALEHHKSGGGGGGGGQSNASPSPSEQQPKPQPTLAQRQAEQLLGSAEREERDVQSKKLKQNKPEPPPGGKDW